MSQKAKELRFSIKDQVGVLERVTKALKESGVNILHLAAWSEGGMGYFHMVTDDNAGAKRALGTIGIRPSESEVVVLNLQNRVGSLERVASQLAKANVNISCLSATSGGKRVAVILDTKNNRKALQVV